MDNNHLANQIKAKLEAGEVLTVVSVFEDLRTFELRHYITEIRTRFHLPIETRWCANNGKRFKEYYLKAA